MVSLQGNLEQIFCPTLDSTLIAAIINDYPDFDTCFDILNSLAEEANSVLDAEGKEILIENELSSGNSSSNFRSSSVPSFSETGDGSITSLECSIDGLSVEDELDYESTCSTTDYDFEYPEGSAEFLKTCFPMLSEVRVDTLLRENDNNVEMVLDVILNEMHLETEQQEKEFSYLQSTSPLISVRDSNCDEDNSLVSESRFKHRKKKRLRKPKQNKIIFQNNGHRPNSNKSSSPNSPSTLGPPTTSSCWNTPSSSIQSKNPWNNNNKDEFIDDNKLSRLFNVFPDHNFESLKQALIICNGEVQSATEMLLSSDTDGVWNGAKRQQGKGIQTVEHQTIHIHDKKQTGNFQHHTSSSKNISRIPSSLINKIYDDDDDGLVDYEDGYDPEYCLKEVDKFFKKQDEAFKKAAQFHRRGAGGTSSYYAEEGWKFNAEMRRWKLRAARSLVKKHSEKRNDEHILDLHGCFVKEALIIVKEWLNDWYPKRMRSATPLKPLKIITGKGNHSPNGVAKLPDAINKFLTEDNWNITKNKGYVLVYGLKNIP